MGQELRATLEHRVDAHLRGRLHQLRRAGELPIVLCGTTSRGAEGQRLHITGLLGTLGRSLAGLEIRPGRGMGGTVVAQARPCRVNDYASSTAITHDFDHMVVAQERIRSIFALPVVVHGAVRGELYGATRDTQPIGDVALHGAGLIAAAAAMDLATLLSSAPSATALFIALGMI